MITRIAASASIVILAASAAHAQDSQYTLGPGSYYELGCHGACQCPIQVHAALTGTFRLTFSGATPLFDTYTVTNVHWSSAERAITGSGAYERGGEVATQQEMVLDLDIAGTSRHLDSGMVIDQTAWPDIVITVDNHLDNPLCYDTVIHLVASPTARYCTADFNGDGDSGTDADIEAFFACIAGNCCADCASPDFNGDGDVGTDADIEAFFRVLAGGSC